MPAADRHTPAELLAENDELARLLLLEVSGHRAPAMLRAFPALVDVGRNETQLRRTLTGVPAARDVPPPFPRRRRRLHHLPRTLQLRRRHPHPPHLRNRTIGRR